MILVRLWRRTLWEVLTQNKQSDFIDSMDKMKQTEQYQQTVDISQQKANDNRSQHGDKMNLKREEMSLKRELKDKDLAIARENKNKYDVASKTTKEDKKKKS